MNILKQLKQAEEAVSPVVATLLLILVAAGGAIGIGVFLQNYGDKQTDKVDSYEGETVLRIGGSSTVYEFSTAALAGFEAANPGITVDLQKGGSGAGKAGVCKGLIDIGSSSSPFDTTGKPGQDLETCPDFNGDGVRDVGQEMTIVKVANDGVVFATLANNAHCDDPATASVKEVPVVTRALAKALYWFNANNFGTRDAALFGTAPADPANTADAGFVEVADDVQWGEVPNSAGGFCIYDGTGVSATEMNLVVEVADRSDQGGTSEVFTQKVLGFSSPKAQLEDAGIVLNAAHQGDGNQGVLSAVQALANDEDALFFTSFGYAGTQSLTIGQFGVTSPVLPTTSNIKANTYEGSRPILYITAGEPSPVEQLWIDYVTATANNIAFSNTADFVSIYA